MTARSFLNVLLSDKSGQVDPTRDHVLTGMERHVPCRDIGKKLGGGYPIRTICTKDFQFIRNFAPERWPAGDPNGFEVAGAQPFTYEQLAKNTLLAFGDVDASPTKAWMVLHRDEPSVHALYERAFGKRPARELYDLRHDPYELHNVAADPTYAAVVKKLEAELMAELKATADPRVIGGGEAFDTYPYLGQPRKAKKN